MIFGRASSFSRTSPPLPLTSILQQNKCESCSAAPPPKSSKRAPKSSSALWFLLRLRTCTFFHEMGNGCARVRARVHVFIHTYTHVYACPPRQGARLYQRAVSVAQPTHSFPHTFNHTYIHVYAYLPRRGARLYQRAVSVAQLTEFVFFAPSHCCMYHGEVRGFHAVNHNGTQVQSRVSLP